MRKTVGTLIGLVLLLFSAAPARAVGPLVGTNCTESWLAVTVDVAGAPLVGPVTYNTYLASGVQTVPAIPPLLNVPTLVASICAGQPAGQKTLWLSALGSASGPALESAMSSPVPFVLMIPSTPTGCAVAAGVFSCAAVTTYTDLTVTPNPVTYENWLMPGSPTAPSGAPVVSTGAAFPIPTTLAAGQYVAFRKALTSPTLGKSTSESAASAAVPFAVSTPSAPTAPTGVSVQ